MAYRADEVKVGLVIVVSLLILAGFVISILGLKVGQPMVTYTVNLKFSGGIEEGTVVRFGGMEVGKVTEVGVSPADDTRIRLSLSVEEGLPIKTDSEAFINSIGILGDYYLEISTGSLGSPGLSPGGEIPSMELVGINEMFASAQAALHKVDATLVILNEKILVEDIQRFRERMILITDQVMQLLADMDLLFSEENRANIAQTLEQVRELVEENKADARETVENFRSASIRMESLAATLDEIAGENREDIDLLITEIRKAVSDIHAATGTMERLIADNANDINLTIDNLRATSANSRDFSETIADEPWRLIWRSRQPEKKAFEAEEAKPVER